MEELLNARLNVISKHLPDLDVIKRKISSCKQLTIRESVKHKIGTFLSSDDDKMNDDVVILFQKYMNKCVICNNVYHTSANVHFIAICDNCVDISANIKHTLVMGIYCFNANWRCLLPYLSGISGTHISRLRAIDTIDKILNNYLKIVDIMYKFDHKIVLLLIMGRCDINFVFNMIPRDVVMYILWFIYDDSE